MGEKEKQSSSCTVERSGTEDTMAVGNRLILVAYAATSGHLLSWPALQLRNMLGSSALPQLGSVLMSMARVTTKGHVDACFLGHHLRLGWCLRAMLSLGPYRSTPVRLVCTATQDSGDMGA